MSISVKHLTKKYGTQHAVNNISFHINKGEIVGFLGPNGAGKSTTMKMITGSINPDSGSIDVCELPVNEATIYTKKKIGYLPEANPLYTEMYVKEYLGFIADIHEIKNKESKISELISLIGLTPESHKKISQLSKGYKQRVGLAAALIHDPEVLILDEPTSGLDPNQIIEIREVIKKLGENKTILFSSHIMQEVESICDRVIIINKGNIIADDSLGNLKKGTSNSHFVSIQFKEPIHPSRLDSIKDCRNITSLTTHSFLIETAQPELVKKQLFELSLQANLNIVSLSSEKQNLEDVFKTLTT